MGIAWLRYLGSSYESGILTAKAVQTPKCRNSLRFHPHRNGRDSDEGVNGLLATAKGCPNERSIGAKQGAIKFIGYQQCKKLQVETKLPSGLPVRLVTLTMCKLVQHKNAVKLPENLVSFSLGYAVACLLFQPWLIRLTEPHSFRSSWSFLRAETPLLSSQA